VLCDVTGTLEDVHGKAVPSATLSFTTDNGAVTVKTKSTGAFSAAAPCGTAEVTISWSKAPLTTLPASAHLRGKAKLAELQARYDQVVVEYDKTEAQLMAARNQVVMLQTQLGELQAKKPSEPTSVQGVKQPSEPATVPSPKKPTEPVNVSSVKKPSEPVSIQSAKKPPEPASTQRGTKPSEPASVPSAKEPSEPARTQSGKKPTEPASVLPPKKSSTAASGTHAGPLHRCRMPPGPGSPPECRFPPYPKLFSRILAHAPWPKF